MPQPAERRVLYRNSGLLGLGNIAALPSYCGNVPGPVTYIVFRWQFLHNYGSTIVKMTGLLLYTLYTYEFELSELLVPTYLHNRWQDFLLL